MEYEICFLLEFFADNDKGSSLYYLDNNIMLTTNLWEAKRFSDFEIAINFLKDLKIPKYDGFQKLYIEPTQHWFHS